MYVLGNLICVFAIFLVHVFLVVCSFGCFGFACSISVVNVLSCFIWGLLLVCVVVIHLFLYVAVLSACCWINYFYFDMFVSFGYACLCLAIWICWLPDDLLVCAFGRLLVLVLG